MAILFLPTNSIHSRTFKHLLHFCFRYLYFIFLLDSHVITGLLVDQIYPVQDISLSHLFNQLDDKQGTWSNNLTFAKYLFSHCVKSVQIRSFFWSVLSCIRTEYRKIRTRKKLRIWTLFTQCLIRLSLSMV